MVKVSRQRRDLDETLTAQPGYALVGIVRVPEAQVSPIRAIWRRVAIALLALLIAVVTVYLGRAGYTDVRGVPLSFIDCLYFATISLTTVGYGDLTPYSEFARLTNVVIIKYPWESSITAGLSLTRGNSQSLLASIKFVTEIGRAHV